MGVVLISDSGVMSLRFSSKRSPSGKLWNECLPLKVNFRPNGKAQRYFMSFLERIARRGFNEHFLWMV